MIQENNRHCDLIQFEVIEHYHNLTLKVVSIVQWIIQNEHHSQKKLQHLFMLDDDTYLNIPRLYKELYHPQKVLLLRIV